MYLAAITENSLYLPAHNNLAYLYELQNKIDKAVTHWKIKAEFSKKDDEWAKKAIAKLQEYGYGQEFLAQKEDIVSDRVIQEGELFDIREISELESKSKPYNPLIDESNQRKIIYFGNDVFDQIQSKDIQKPVEKYKRHMVKGKIYYMKQDYKKSLSEFEEAYNLQPTEESKGWIDKIKEYIKQQQ